MQDGGHQHPGDGLVEDGVAHTDDVDHGGGTQHRQHVWRHPLPEVQQEALHLNAPPNRRGRVKRHSHHIVSAVQAQLNYSMETKDDF